MRWLALAALACALLTLAATASLAANDVGNDAGFHVNQNPSHDGVYQLSWTAPGPVVVEASPDADFTHAEIVYRGHDTASTLSGRPDGETWYRLLDADSNRVLAAPVRVEVRHHPLSRALTFFSVGLVVFVATVVLIVRGDRATRMAPAGSTSGGESRHG
jgi:hypothetical protein